MPTIYLPILCDLLQEFILIIIRQILSSVHTIENGSYVSINKYKWFVNIGN
jgi:hypothetical protein